MNGLTQFNIYGHVYAPRNAKSMAIHRRLTGPASAD